MKRINIFPILAVCLFSIPACSSEDRFTACPSIQYTEAVDVAVKELREASIEVRKVSEYQFCVEEKNRDIAWEAAKEAVKRIRPVGRMEINKGFADVALAVLEEQGVEFSIIERDEKLIIHVSPDQADFADELIADAMKKKLESGN